jgi:hypothetical protein
MTRTLSDVRFARFYAAGQALAPLEAHESSARTSTVHMTMIAILQGLTYFALGIQTVESEPAQDSHQRSRSFAPSIGYN